MSKIFYCLFILFFLSQSCTKYSQNFDNYVIGKVYDENGGVSNVKLLLYRGRWGNFIAPSYSKFDSVYTDNNGNYTYFIKDNPDYNAYRINCVIPKNYTRIENDIYSVYIKRSIVNSKTINDTINFKLIK